MSSGFGESTRVSQPNPSCSSGNSSNNDAGDFECNICFDLAQDPVITLCGHLFCWPCLYKWLHHHSHSQECPVCKALVQEEKLVPLYGRGKSQTDPRNKSYPGMEIPRRPSGQRPETASPPPPPDANYHTGMAGFGLMGGFIPMATATFGNIALSTGFGGFAGLIPSLFNIHFHGFQDATVYGTTSGYPFGFNTFQGGNTRDFNSPANGQVQRQEDNVLKNLLMLIGFLVVITVIFVM
jgi:E3 ubiquitin-protein ligase RNF5